MFMDLRKHMKRRKDVETGWEGKDCHLADYAEFSLIVARC